MTMWVESRSRRHNAPLSLRRLTPRKKLPLDLAGGKRLAEQKALHLGAAFGGDPVELFGGFHALGGGRHAHAVGERCDCPHDVERAGILRDVFYERAVDLD